MGAIPSILWTEAMMGAIVTTEVPGFITGWKLIFHINILYDETKDIQQTLITKKFINMTFWHK